MEACIFSEFCCFFRVCEIFSIACDWLFTLEIIETNIELCFRHVMLILEIFQETVQWWFTTKCLKSSWVSVFHIILGKICLIVNYLTLQALTPQNGQTHWNKLLTNCLSVWPFVGLALKGLSYTVKLKYWFLISQLAAPMTTLSDLQESSLTH